MTDRRATVIVALIVVTTIMMISIPVTAAQTDIQIQSVNVSVDQPAPGERFTLSVNIANLPSSSGSVEVTDVYVREGIDEFARIEDTGTIAPGGDLDIPLTMSIDEPGHKRLSVHVVVEDSDGDHRRINYPLYVEVQEPNEALISIAALDPTAGQESVVDVTVSNGDTAPISNVQLEVGGDGDVEKPERINASLAPRSQTVYTFDVTFPEIGPQRLNATLTYTTNSGSTRTVQRTITTAVEQATNDVELDVSNQVQNGSSVIRAELQQFGNVELRDVEIRAESDGETVARVPLPNVLSEGTQTVALRDDDIPAGNITVVTIYTAGSERQTTTASLLYSKYSPAPTSAITLTGLELTRQGDVLTLDGDAANVGTSQVNSVVISVVKTDAVRPVSPNREYFINQISPNEFANFEVTAQIPENVDQIPVRVQYTVDGQRVSSIIPLDIGDIEVNTGNSQNGGPSPFAIGIVLLIVAIAGIGVYRCRNQ
ncbi:hypothetical protein [Halorubrum sp. Atlit-26R]|uniref:hypothetical protein n=1 Tax=Halorubrum sp. Atlit-26R TaxID=2282128 RepID=UPI000EF26ECA|nr:hypothetical protein [Halorubrum sp. Atlit-26R]RLM62630.1 hypothetical protein DVK07_18285 [Halorubrum sp. Atlit-26R]